MKMNAGGAPLAATSEDVVLRWGEGATDDGSTRAGLEGPRDDVEGAERRHPDLDGIQHRQVHPLVLQEDAVRRPTERARVVLGAGEPVLRDGIDVVVAHHRGERHLELAEDLRRQLELVPFAVIRDVPELDHELRSRSVQVGHGGSGRHLGPR
jgi:hypothetical protein